MVLCCQQAVLPNQKRKSVCGNALGISRSLFVPATHTERQTHEDLQNFLSNDDRQTEIVAISQRRGITVAP